MTRAARSATRKRRAAASTCAVIARSCPSTTAASAPSPPTSSSPTSARRSPPAPGTSRSAIPTSSTARPMRVAIVTALARECPGVSYDVTIKVEHLRRHDDVLPMLKANRLRLRDHRRRVVRRRGAGAAAQGTHVRRLRAGRGALPASLGLPLSPTFVAFTPWTTIDGYIWMLHEIARLDLVAARRADPVCHPAARAAGLADAGARRTCATRSSGSTVAR